MKILIITHASFEKPGSISEWAKKNGHQTTEIKPFKGEKLSEANTFDFLIVMGGPQSPLAINKAPYLADEIAFIKSAISKHKPLLGICLGAQLIAEALGAKTERSPHREIGIYPIELLDDAKKDPVFQHFPKKFDVMHWHNDMPGIPKDAVLLAKSAGCPRQIFRYGDRVYGFQCHFELTQELVRNMVAHCESDLKSDTFIRSANELVTADYATINAEFEKVLNHLASFHAQ